MKHEIERLSGRPAEAAIFSSEVPRGTFVQFKAGDYTTFDLADGTVMDAGCLSRDVTTAGPTLGDAIYPGRTDATLPVKAGQAVAAEHAQRLVVEGSDFMTSNVTAGTATNTPLSLTGGKLDTVASGQLPLFRVVEQLTPETAGNARIRIERTALRAP